MKPGATCNGSLSLGTACGVCERCKKELGQKQIDEIIEDLKEQICSCVKLGEDLDDKSWNYQVGVLLSANEAKKIVEHVTAD